MLSRRPIHHLPIGTVLINAFLLNAFFGFSLALTPVQAQNQNRVLIINADQPNVWTLEQAHYLLAQMHRRNLDLRTKNLEELDPNEIAGLRFDVLRSLVELGVSFDDANRVSNQMLRRNMNFNTARREELITRRARLRDESLTLTREIANLQTAKAAATTEETSNRIDAEIAAKTAVRAELDKEVEFIDQELGTLSAPSGEFQRTEAEVQFDPERLPKSIFDDVFQQAAASQIEKFNQQPRLNASLRLENFLQMQYEIIAKQLTLLRDEVGPGERLLFLELPQTVNVTHHEANNKWAQSWWRIVGYTRNRAQFRRAPAQRAAEARRASVSPSPTIRCKPQSQPQPRCKPQSQPQPRCKPQSQPQPRCKPQSEPQPRCKSQSEPQPRCKSQPQPRPRALSECA